MDKQQLIEAVKAHAKAQYENGWDTVVECYDDADIADSIGGASTVEEAINAVASELGIDVALSGYVVTTHDVDGSIRRAFPLLSEAVARYVEMLGRQPQDGYADRIESGGYITGVSDFGTRVELHKAA